MTIPKFLDTFSRDIRYALRSLRKSPGFTVVAVLSLGLGIGATTTMYSVIDAIDFRPLPYASGDRLVGAWEVHPKSQHWGMATASAATAADWREQAHSFEGMVLYGPGWIHWQHDNELENLTTPVVSPGFFSLLGVRPLLGREFGSGDTLPGAPHVTMLTYEFWRSRFGGDPRVIGTHLRSFSYEVGSAQTLTVVGVLPEGFRFGDRVDAWQVIEGSASLQTRASRKFYVIARLKQNVSLSAASADLATISTRLASAYPTTNRDWGATAVPLRTLLLFGYEALRTSRLAFFAIVAFVLLIAVANVAGLFLSRTAARQHEFTVRAAMGASRSQLATQLIVESVCVGVGGGTLGVLLAVGGVGVSGTWFLADVMGLPPTVDVRVLAFAGVTAIAVGVATALLSVLQIPRTDLQRALGERAAAVPRGRTATALLVLQVAGGLVLLTGAGLLTKDFSRLVYADRGFDPHHLYGVSVQLGDDLRGNGERVRSIAAELQLRAAAVPGVVSANVELGVSRSPVQYARSDGSGPLASGVRVATAAIDPSYVRDIRTSLKAGREFSADDRAGAPAVALINASAAQALWPGQTAIGRRIVAGDSGTLGESVLVVGVLSDSRVFWAEKVSVVYRPLAQATFNNPSMLNLWLRIPGPMSRVSPALLGAIRSVTGSPQVAATSVEAGIRDGLLRWRLNTIALNGFAAFAVLLASMGIYATVAYSVTRRTREIGTRMALGAQGADVLALVTRRTVALAIAGVTGGVVGSLGLGRVLRSLLYGTSGVDPLVLAVSALLMMGIAVLATYIPARRATTVDPMTALRTE